MHDRPEARASAPLSVTSGSVITIEASYSEASIWHGFVIPRPPTLTGNANKTHSAGVQVCPVIGGIRAWPMDALAALEDLQYQIMF